MHRCSTSLRAAGGDNDTPFATGYMRGSAMRAPMRAVALRFRTSVLGQLPVDRVSRRVRHTGSPTYETRMRSGRRENGAMLYDWNKIEACATSHQQLLPCDCNEGRTRLADRTSLSCNLLCAK